MLIEILDEILLDEGLEAKRHHLVNTLDAGLTRNPGGVHRLGALRVLVAVGNFVKICQKCSRVNRLTHAIASKYKIAFFKNSISSLNLPSPWLHIMQSRPRTLPD